MYLGMLQGEMDYFQYPLVQWIDHFHVQESKSYEPHLHHLNQFLDRVLCTFFLCLNDNFFKAIFFEKVIEYEI